MQDAKFTPGPWTKKSTSSVDDRFGKGVADLSLRRDLLEMDANAALIAAAPDLYDALWQILDDMGRDGTCCCSAAKEQAIVAMARARGETTNTSS